MQENEFFSVEPIPRRAPLKWRIPALLALLAAFYWVWLSTGGDVQLSGNYGGYLGSMASDNKIGFRLRIQQVGRNATADATLSRVYGGKMTNHDFTMTGNVKGSKVNLTGRLENGGSLTLSGYFGPTSNREIQINGTGQLSEVNRKFDGPFLLKKVTSATW